MTITVRLPDDLETKLRRRLKQEGKALSDFVREAIAEKIGRDAKAKPSAWATDPRKPSLAGMTI